MIYHLSKIKMFLFSIKLLFCSRTQPNVHFILNIYFLLIKNFNKLFDYFFNYLSNTTFKAFIFPHFN